MSYLNHLTQPIKSRRQVGVYDSLSQKCRMMTSYHRGTVYSIGWRKRRRQTPTSNVTAVGGEERASPSTSDVIAVGHDGKPFAATDLSTTGADIIEEKEPGPIQEFAEMSPANELETGLDAPGEGLDRGEDVGARKEPSAGKRRRKQGWFGTVGLFYRELHSRSGQKTACNACEGKFMNVTRPITTVNLDI